MQEDNVFYITMHGPERMTRSGKSFPDNRPPRLTCKLTFNSFTLIVAYLYFVQQS